MTNLHPIADEGRRKLHVGAVNAINQAIDEIERREERLALEEERRFDRRYQHIKDTAARYQLRLERQLSAVNRMNGGSEKGIKLALEEVKEIIEDRNFWGSKGPLDRLLGEYPEVRGPGPIRGMFIPHLDQGQLAVLDQASRDWLAQHKRNVEDATDVGEVPCVPYLRHPHGESAKEGVDIGDTGHPKVIPAFEGSEWEKEMIRCSMPDKGGHDACDG